MRRGSSSSGGHRHRCLIYRAVTGGVTEGGHPRKATAAGVMGGELQHRERHQTIQYRISTPHPRKMEDFHPPPTVQEGSRPRTSMAICRCGSRANSGNRTRDSMMQGQDHQLDLARESQTMTRDKGDSRLRSGLEISGNRRGSQLLLDLRIHSSSSTTIISLLNKRSRRYSTIIMETPPSRWSPHITTTRSKGKNSEATTHHSSSKYSNCPKNPSRQLTNTSPHPNSSSNNHNSTNNQKPLSPSSPSCEHKISPRVPVATSGQSTHRPLQSLPLRRIISILAICR